MADRWVTSTSQVVPPVMDVAVSYVALVTSRVESSSLHFNPDLSPDQLADALESPPEWTLRAWTVPSSRDEAGRKVCALQKLVALFSFGAQLPGGTAEEVEAALRVKFPSLLSTAFQLKRIAVDAQILTDGTARWAYEIPEAGRYADGIVRDVNLDVVVQNVVRLDLLQRLEPLGTP